jgi:hypothetical protein
LSFTFDNSAFNYLDTAAALLPMNMSVNADTITLQWSANSLNINDLLTIGNDTLIQIWFTPNNDCYSELNWNVNETSLIYKADTLSMALDLINGDALWVNTYAPILSFSPNDTTFLPTSFLVDWEDVLCPSSYRLQVATDSTFDNPEFDISNISESEYLISDLLPYQQYFWRVAQYDSDDQVHWSSIWKFRTDRQDDTDYRLYPVPTKDVLNIWFENDNSNSAEIKIFNSIGQLMKSYAVTRVGKLIQLSLSPLMNGVYFIQYEDATMLWSEKIIVQQ